MIHHPDQKTGALYGLLPPEQAPDFSLTAWNQARLRCLNRQCEHWINGTRVLQFDLRSPEMKKRLRDAAGNQGQSIISSLAAVVESRDRVEPAAIALQHHSGKVWFRNLKLRELSPSAR